MHCKKYLQNAVILQIPSRTDPPLAALIVLRLRVTERRV